MADGRVPDVKIGHLMMRGFTILEAVTVIVIVAVMAALLVPLGNSLVNTNRASQTFDQLQTLYLAIVGDPKNGNFGYIGDVGTFPTSLGALVSNPGVAGWNGPYVNDPSIEDGVIYDAFGNPINHFYQLRVGTPPSLPTTLSATADYLGLISPGPDHGAAAGATPTTANYAGQAGNADNIVYPRWTDNAGLLSYQYMGTLSYNIFNQDSNPGVNALVPGCPMLYAVEVTSVPRGTSDQVLAQYSPGGLSMDLVQGLYNVRVVASSVVFSSSFTMFQEKVSIVPGSVNSRTVTLGSLDSSSTRTFGFTIQNNSGSTITVSATTGTITPTVTNNTSRTYNVPACMPLKVSTVAGTLDSFYMPAVNLFRRYALTGSPTQTYTLRVINSVSGFPQVHVFSNNVQIGTVSNKGTKRAKDFFKVRGSDNIDVRSSSGISQASQATIGSDTTLPVP